MLPPDSRVVAVELLRAPEGYTLDSAVLTSYSLDLETLLALPLAVLSQADAGIEQLLRDPLLLLESLRESGQKIHVFVDESAIAVPRTERPLFSMLEASVHSVKAPNGGAFHPKVWAARFVAPGRKPMLRVAVLSRNLTYDRSWDLGIVSCATEKSGAEASSSRDLARLFATLPSLCTESLPTIASDLVSSMSESLGRTLFPAPEGFTGNIEYTVFGLDSGVQSPWQPLQSASRVLAMAPFVNQTALSVLAQLGSKDKRSLISRQDSLDALPESGLEPWGDVRVMSESIEDESEDGVPTELSGLHAKLLGLEHSWDVTWFAGSSNLTAAAFTGANVEMMASVTGRRSKSGIERFEEAGIGRMLEPYRRIERPVEDAALTKAIEELESAKRTVIDSALRIATAEADTDWQWTLEGKVELPDSVAVHHWPISLSASASRPLVLPVSWRIPTSHLTAFVAFHCKSSHPKVEDIHFVLKLPTQGFPENRVNQVLRTLIDSPERFLQFLRALLGGLEGLVDWADGRNEPGTGESWNLPALGDETLLEDLLRMASRDPQRLEPIRRLIYDLEQSDGDKLVIPREFLHIWKVVERSLAERKA
ncbi:phospholipase D family protein [Abyssibacter profundi]|uniref:PLD phosphodiesterase domain-containing protein n=1 Tax=Abyssibacter profundi TaxID=2182787 RepID=A0A383XQC8_9GAMM|nr:phospholipase D family protein [Abyssibacter profundi]PWN54832.1 hypothetical protein DEH80_15315 [Abyssibacter profundi]